MLRALTRAVSPAIESCELTHLDRVSIDHARAVEQHAAYEAALVRAGCEIVPVEPAADLADSVFVEDTALVLDDLAILTRPGAVSRRPEVDAVGRVLEAWRPLVRIEEPGTVDGGDVLRIGRRLYVGYQDIPKVLNGLGVSIVSTSRGVMTDAAARDGKVGGEILCEVW